MKLRNHLSVFITLLILISGTALAESQMEVLTRGLVAIVDNGGVFMSWRLLNTDSSAVGFNVYKDGVQINDSLITASTNYFDSEGNENDTYQVIPVLDGVDQEASKTVSPWNQKYKTLPLQKPANGTAKDGSSYSYSPNDCSAGDLDGDGEYEIIVKWDPSNSHDNAHSGYTGNVYLDGYKMDGTFLWRIDLGINIRAGAHYTQFMVYDLDGDGVAEVACKTAEGSKDGLGNYIANDASKFFGDFPTVDNNADHRKTNGYILKGYEFLTVFSGQTGEELATTYYLPARNNDINSTNVSGWGDNYGNRVDRFLACVAYLDGERPSLVMCRGYYTRSVLAAWDWRDGTLTHRWTFDTNDGYREYAGQGNHQVSVADVDDDGKDEIIYGAMAVDDDGTGLWNSGLGHGDALHVSDIDPDRAGLERWGPFESGPGSALLDARTGEVIWIIGPAGDVGRGTAANVTDAYEGMECWASNTNGLINCKGDYAGRTPSSTNHVIWWDGDLLRELLNSNDIKKYNGGTLLYASGCTSNNGSKSNPGLQADLFGDWREEVIFRETGNTKLRIYSTTIPTEYRLTTLMHDRVYREGVAWQNVAYNQPPHTSYFVGKRMFIPDSLRPPSIPVDFTATASADSIVLTWRASTADDFAGYNLYRSESEGGVFTKLNTELLTDNRYTDTNIVLDQFYYYAVTAVDDHENESDFSKVEEAVPTQRPDIPTNVIARNSLNAIKLFWDMQDDDNILGYNIYRSLSESGTFRIINKELITELEYENSPLPRNITFYYKVTSVNHGSLESFESDMASAKTGSSVAVQSEDAIHEGTVFVEENHSGYHGTAFCNFNTDDSAVEFQNLPGFGGGQTMLYFRYALGNTDRTGSLIVNGTATDLTMKGTGEWTNWMVDSTEITLEYGFDNVIRFEATGSDFGNLDEIVIGPDYLSPVEGASEGHSLLPTHYRLHQNYPNPFNPATSIAFDLPLRSHVLMNVYDVNGRLVETIANESYAAGSYQVQIDGRELSSGIYFVKVNMREEGLSKNMHTFTRKITLIK